MALLLVPAAGLVAVVGLQLFEAFGVVTSTADIEELTQVAQAERDLLHSLQIERTRSLEYIADLAGGVPGGVPAPLTQARTAVEVARTALDGTRGRLDLAAIAPEVLAADEEASDALAALGPLRFNLDAGRAEGQNVISSFDTPLEALLQVDQLVIALIDQPEVRDNLQGSLAVSQIKDAAIRSGDVVLLAASGAIGEDETVRLLTEAQADTQTWLGVAQTYLSPQGVARATDALEGLPTTADAITMVAGGDADALADQAGGMADVTEASAGTLRDLEIGATDRAVRAATDIRSGAVQRATVHAILAGVVLVVGLMLLVLLLRGVVSPLRQLTGLADRVRTTLPETVERVAGGEQAGESAFDDPEAQALTSRTDELGELARAIRASTDEATRVAADQAATRAGVTRTIEDVARREQALVERQLSLLDQLEAAEEDPDQLAQLFRLDHLATRMRRNAENLLLLASGRLPGGQDATPVPLIDVARTAASEIEQYARVDVRVGISSTVIGSASTPVSHLLAELIENATRFSPPTSRVAVGARMSEDGVVVTITDHGIGMSEPEIADARRKLAEPPLLEVAESRRLGLYVVGLIAQRLGITVDLRSATDHNAADPGAADHGAADHRGEDVAGITVEVAIPQQLFVAPGTEAAVQTEAGAAPSVPGRVEPVAGPRLTDFSAAPRLETTPDALSEMRHLLDAQLSTPPALPDDVEPPAVQGLPSRGAGPALRGRSAPGASGLSLSAASGGRTVDLNPQAVGQLMASLSGGDLFGDDVDLPGGGYDIEGFSGTPAAPAKPTDWAAFDARALTAPDADAGDPDDRDGDTNADDTGHPDAAETAPRPDPAPRRRGRGRSPTHKRNGTAPSWSTPFPPHGT